MMTFITEKYGQKSPVGWSGRATGNATLIDLLRKSFSYACELSNVHLTPNIIDTDV